ncbi:hypothetical protein MNBD_GAMMA11-998 [hydrothermal vent metagenome]|uniref:Uncharacterized protein n=1 Tax=hydrothermal vent metagenome TaxID=652676 RepID=A0A3B0XXM2_9ZZZZ
MTKHLTILFLLVLSSPLHAALVSSDYLTPGDNLITRDTVTGLEWLDLTVTQGLSPDAVQSNPVFSAQGFRYALTSDVSTLFQNAGITITSNDPVSGQINEVTALINLLGATTVLPDGRLISEGYYHPFVTPDGGLKGDWVYKTELSLLDDTLYFAAITRGEASLQSYANPQFGNLLVRPVPLPAAIWLFAAGLTGLVGISRRNKKTAA